jgi:hypothetical protein
MKILDGPAASSVKMETGCISILTERAEGGVKFITVSI